VPKWQFLCYFADQQGIALHGSGNPAIDVFEPHRAIDLGEFGNQEAVYAAGDGIWAMFYAIVDRAQYPMTLSNACIRLANASGQISQPLYVFSINRQALVHEPWRSGMVYLFAESFKVAAPFSLASIKF
jgi:hypothetical protein